MKSKFNYGNYRQLYTVHRNKAPISDHLVIPLVEYILSIFVYVYKSYTFPFFSKSVFINNNYKSRGSLCQNNFLISLKCLDDRSQSFSCMQTK